MVFDPNIPQPDDDAGTDSRPQIQTNFDQWNTIYGENHVEFDFDETAAVPYDLIKSVSRGKHKQITNVNLSGDPSLADNAEESQYYAKTLNAIISPFLQSPPDEEGQPSIVNKLTADFISLTNGETVVPGGIHLKWGFAQMTAANPTTFNFVGAPINLTNFPNNCFGVLIVHQDINDPIRVLTVDSCSTTDFVVKQTTLVSGFRFRFLVIGN